MNSWFRFCFLSPVEHVSLAVRRSNDRGLKAVVIASRTSLSDSQKRKKNGYPLCIHLGNTAAAASPERYSGMNFIAVVVFKRKVIRLLAHTDQELTISWDVGQKFTVLVARLRLTSLARAKEEASLNDEWFHLYCRYLKQKRSIHVIVAATDEKVSSRFSFIFDN